MIGDNSGTHTEKCSERHVEVLRAAMGLMAERGFSGASLRELARRLEMSQPSLYHYFDSKDALVEQITDWYSDQVLLRHARMLSEQPPSLDDVASMFRYALQRVLDTWNDPQHVIFVRFLFAVTTEKPELGRLFRSLFMDRGFAMCRALIQHAATALPVPIEADDIEQVVHVAINALVMQLIQDRILHMADPERDVDPEGLIEFIVDVTSKGMLARAAGDGASE